MKDALTIMVVHFSRQQGQSLLHVGQDLRLKAGANFLQRINEPLTRSGCNARFDITCQPDWISDKAWRLVALAKHDL
jgi:hypothetical protein